LEDEQHKPVYKWTLTNAWCTKLSGPSLKGQGNEIAIETMELAYDRIDIS
jgi:phage tail-like protein